MQATIKRWGNSLALRIPAHIAEALDVRENSCVEFVMEDGNLVIKPVAHKRQYSLSQLLEGIRPENIHRETETGRPVGDEIW